MTCKTVGAFGRSMTWRVTVGGQQSSPSVDTMSHGPATVTSVRVGSPTTGGSLMATVGSEAVYLVGTNMGPVGTGGSDVVVTYGSAGNPQYTATGCAVDIAHTRMRCVSVAGVGASHVWTVSVGGVAGVTSSGSSGMT